MSNPTQEENYRRATLLHRQVTSIRVDPELWSRFKQACVERGTWTCPVLEALMEAWIEGQKATATVIKPVVINLTMQHIVSRRRGRTTYLGPENITPIACDGLRHEEVWPGYLGWCRRVKRWIRLEDCGSCRLNPNFYPGMP